MRQVIHSIRQKPPHHKKAIALGASGLITALVFTVWFSTQTFFAAPQVIVKIKQEQTPVEMVAHAVASVWTGVMSIFK